MILEGNPSTYFWESLFVKHLLATTSRMILLLVVFFLFFFLTFLQISQVSSLKSIWSSNGKLGEEIH